MLLLSGVNNMLLLQALQRICPLVLDVLYLSKEQLPVVSSKLARQNSKLVRDPQRMRIYHNRLLRPSYTKSYRRFVYMNSERNKKNDVK